MILRPRREDHKVIGKYTGKIMVGVGLLMLVPLLVSMAFGEWDTVLDFTIGMSVCLIFGLGLQLLSRTDEDMKWSHGLIVASVSWIFATILGAIPHYLSGHEGSFLDAMFDLMSGYTTTGLYLMQDLDHISYGLNTWRHLLTYAGGQGIVVIALTFLVRGTSGAFKLYVGEAKDERLLPNVVQTARAIWVVSLTWLVVGSVAFTVLHLLLGMEPVRATLHGVWVFMGGWSTGGFAPQSFNTVYYHSFIYEIVSMIVFFAGSLNFALHWALWRGDHKEMRRNIETISFAVTCSALVLAATIYLARAGIYTDTMMLFRKSFYMILSGHTTTGWGTIYSRAFVTQWGPMGMLLTTIAMAIGASASSTAGGIKGFRIGVLTKSYLQDIKRAISPESAFVRVKLHHIKDTLLEDRLVRSVMTVTIMYLTLYAALILLGVAYGYPLPEAAFEGVSVGANTGLSCGVTTPTMPALMKALYIVGMWLGRLEFMSVFALLGHFYALMRGRS
jgi:trk system potassium uptake protein TrkH